MNKELIAYVVRLSGERALGEKDRTYLSGTYRSIRDLERIGDYAENIVEYATVLSDSSQKFSDDAKYEISQLAKLIHMLYKNVIDAYQDGGVSALATLAKLRCCRQACGSRSPGKNGAGECALEWLLRGVCLLHWLISGSGADGPAPECPPELIALLHFALDFMPGLSRITCYPSFEMNLSLSTMNLRCVPSPSNVSPEKAVTLNSNFLPSTFVTSASALTTSPIFEGLR